MFVPEEAKLLVQLLITVVSLPITAALLIYVIKKEIICHVTELTSVIMEIMAIALHTLQQVKFALLVQR